MSSAFWNRFPFIYPDIGTYLGSGFKPEMPIDRPITYGLFIYVTSLGGFSLWFTIFIQAFLTIYVIRLVLDFFVNEEINHFVFLIIISILTIFTSISFPIGQLMPDFSTPIMLLCLFLIIAKATLTKRTIQSIFFLFFLTNALHISHVLLNLLLLSALLLFSFFRIKKLIFLKSKTVLQLMGLSLLGILTMLPPLSKSSHVFRMGNLVHNQILQVYLEDNCAEKNYKLCAYKNEIPKEFDVFVWDSNSPLHKIGWKASKPEFKEIIADIYTTPKYLKLIVKSSFKNTWKQLQLNSVGEGNIPYALDAPYIIPLQTYCKASAQFEKSRQYQSEKLIPTSVNIFHKIVIALSLLFFILLNIWIYLKSKLTDNHRFFLIGISMSIVINAYVTATIVYPHNRAGCKVIWLIPFMVIVILLCLRKKRPPQ
jgi:hypothetical protein